MIDYRHIMAMQYVNCTQNRYGIMRRRAAGNGTSEPVILYSELGYGLISVCGRPLQSVHVCHADDEAERPVRHGGAAAVHQVWQRADVYMEPGGADFCILCDMLHVLFQ